MTYGGVLVNSERTVRLLAFGDCNTNSDDPDQGTAASGLVEALLESGYQTELINRGVGMFSSREGLAQSWDDNPPADIAIINYGLVDAWHTTIPQFYVPYYPHSRFRKWLRKLLKFVKRILRKGVLRNLVVKGPVVPPAEFEGNLEGILCSIVKKNPAAAVYLWATLPVTGDPQRNRSITLYNRLLQKVALRHSAVFVDTETVLADLPVSERFLDGVHWTPKTARWIGEHICSLYQARTSCRKTDRKAA